jgi:autotransporter-associated beta strand protein
MKDSFTVLSSLQTETLPLNNKEQLLTHSPRDEKADNQILSGSRVNTKPIPAIKFPHRYTGGCAFCSVLFLLLGFVLAGGMVVGQTRVTWRTDGPSDGKWEWGSSCENVGDGQWYYNDWGGFRKRPDCLGNPNDIYFDGNGKNTMDLNGSDNFIARSIFFTSNASDARTLNSEANRTLYLKANNGDPKIENNSTATHTFNVPISLNNWAQLNPVSGDLVFNGNIYNNGNNIDVYGGNSKMLTFSGVISGTGKLILDQYSKVKLSATNSYTGNTEINKGELWIETSGDAIASGSIIYLGNAEQLANVAKFFLSKNDGGVTFSRTITINNGDASTRFLGGLNASGTNTFSAGIVISTAQSLNLEAVNSGGITEFTGAISGDGAVTILGAGTIKFSGTNTYTGATTVSAGTLEIQGDLASSLITVANGAKLVINGSHVDINALTINLGGIVEILAGKSLTVTGTLINNATSSGLVIKSDANGTGSLIEHSGVAATVQRYIMNDFKWHFLSSPVSSQAIWPAFAPTPTGTPLTFGPGTNYGWDFYYYNPNVPSTGLYWVNLRKTGGAYNNGTVDAASDTAGFGTQLLQLLLLAKDTL